MLLNQQGCIFLDDKAGMNLLHLVEVQTSVRERDPVHGSIPAHNEDTRTNRLLGLYPPLPDLILRDGLLKDQRELFRTTMTLLPRPVRTFTRCSQQLLHIGSSASFVLAKRRWPHSVKELKELLYSSKRRLNRLEVIASMRAAKQRQIERGYLTSPEQELLVIENQRLVGFFAKKYTGKGLSWYELCSAGYVGLVKAARVWDPSRAKFSTCAGYWIKGEITEAFKELQRHKASDRRVAATVAGVPLVFDAESEQKRDVDEALLLVARKDLDKQNDPEGEALTDHVDLKEAVAQEADEEIDRKAGETGYSAKQARSEGLGSSAGHALEWSDDPASDNNKPGSGASIEFVEDMYQSQLSLEDIYDFSEFKEALDKLEPRQALVVRMRLGLDGHRQNSFKKIGDALDVSTQYARAFFTKTFEQLVTNNPNLQELFEQTNIRS